MEVQKIIEVKELTSSNDHMKKLVVADKLPEGSVVLALHQKKGRGMGQNSWESEKGKNLTFSLLLRPTFLPAENMFLISKTISLGIVDYLNKLDRSFTIKWPNDIYYKDKKICGILIENQLLGNKLNYSIIGIGININQEVFKSDAPNPISLLNIFNKKFNTTSCLNGILKQISIWYDMLSEGWAEKINEAYFTQLYRNTGYHAYNSEGILFKAQLKAVENDGKLVLQTAENEIKSFYFKEVEFIML
jgi:BirA family biotin operon repressor/biotin-[acetyl-CoA-carboxylase] ligase